MNMNIKKRIGIICLILVVLFSLFAIQAGAYTDASEYLIQYDGCILSGGGNGKIVIEFSVFGKFNMTEIGASKIVLYEKPSGTTTWTYKKTFLPKDYSDMLTSGDSYHSGSVEYDGKVGASYKAVITAYAADSEGSDSKTYTIYN